jgi:hypothetical protein
MTLNAVKAGPISIRNDIAGVRSNQKISLEVSD